MKLLLNWLLKALILLVTAYLLPGFIIESYLTAFVVAAVLGFLNVFLKPVLTFLTLPINFLTLGLFTFIINALLLLLTSALVKGFQIDSFLTAILASVIISVLSLILHQLV